MVKMVERFYVDCGDNKSAIDCSHEYPELTERLPCRFRALVKKRMRRVNLSLRTVASETGIPRLISVCYPANGDSRQTMR